MLWKQQRGEIPCKSLGEGSRVGMSDSRQEQDPFLARRDRHRHLKHFSPVVKMRRESAGAIFRSVHWCHCCEKHRYGQGRGLMVVGYFSEKVPKIPWCLLTGRQMTNTSAAKLLVRRPEDSVVGGCTTPL